MVERMKPVNGHCLLFVGRAHKVCPSRQAEVWLEENWWLHSVETKFSVNAGYYTSNMLSNLVDSYRYLLVDDIVLQRISFTALKVYAQNLSIKN